MSPACVWEPSYANTIIVFTLSFRTLFMKILPFSLQRLPVFSFDVKNNTIIGKYGGCWIKERWLALQIQMFNDTVNITLLLKKMSLSFSLSYHFAYITIKKYSIVWIEVRGCIFRALQHISLEFTVCLFYFIRISTLFFNSISDVPFACLCCHGIGEKHGYIVFHYSLYHYLYLLAYT